MARSPRNFARIGAALCCATLVVQLAACGEESPSGPDGVTVVASTTIVADLAANVAGERAGVVSLLEPNSDPHEFEPLPSDAAALADADLTLRSGGEADAWLGELTEGAGADARTVELIDSVETIAGDHEHAHAGDEHAGDEHAEPEPRPTEVDPHWWLDPRNAVEAVEAIRDELIAVDPTGRAAYRRNAAAYVGELERLDREIAACMERVPERRRELVTSHDSLGYFSERYGIEVVGAAIPALSTGAQPSLGETAELVDAIRARDAPAVFPEIGVSAELERAIAAEAGVELGGELYTDTLGPEGSATSGYLGAMASNAETMLAGFGAPAGCRIAASPG